MSGFQSQKAIVRAHHAALDAADANAVGAALARHTAPDWRWMGYHPFGELTGADSVARRFWAPLKAAMTTLHRREDVFFAGANDVDGGASVWVASMGHLVGLFDSDWLGIRPTGRMVAMRYATFHRVEGERIAETAFFFDIPQVMMQAGLRPFPPATGAQLVQPGPATHDGLLVEAQPEDEGAATLALIKAMIADIGQWNSGLALETELRRTWAEDMIWWGPAGIGATMTIPRYARQHSGPFRGGFTDRSKTNHRARLAEGHYGGFFGWPNFTARPTGGFMGMPGTDRAGEFRVIDIYRRAGDRLAENWVFIDLLHFWHMQGVDILARTVKDPAT